MTDLTDSPLNLAHVEGRKAERFQKVQKWSDAIKCHSKAVEYLGAASASTRDMRALESVRLQQDYHERQVALLTHRQKYYPNVVPTPRVHPVTCHDNSRDTDTNLNLQLHVHSDEQSAQDMPTTTREALQTIEDCDSLLHMLNKRAQLSATLPNHSLVAGIKTPKQEHVVVEELRIQNEELRSHIMKLLQENQQQAMQLAALQARHERLSKIAAQSGIDFNDGLTEKPEMDNSGTNVDQPETADSKPEPQAASAEDVGSNQEPGHESEDEDLYFTMKYIESGDLPPLEIPHFEFDSKS